MLQEFDCFIGGTKKQYTEIAHTALKHLDAEPLKSEIDNMLIRGGVFWSKRKNTLIAGKLKNNSKPLDFKTFLIKLKQTVNN